MAGPVSSYLTTQLAAQTAFTVPFGLLALVNSAIATATSAGEFNVTVDCSLFVTEDVSNLRIYLDSLGYIVEFAKGTNEKSLLIDWGRFLDIPGTEVVVDQGTSPWVISGTVAISNFPLVTATDGTTTTVSVGTSSTVLAASNSSRKAFSVFNTTGTVYVLLGSGSATTTHFTIKLATQGFLSGDAYTGAISAVKATGTGDINITEFV